MDVLKFSADQVFDGSCFTYGNKVLIAEPNGTIVDLVEESDAGDDVRKLTGILAPCFINCHCHLELSHMKGQIPERTGLVPFLTRVVQQRHATEEEIVTAIEKAEDEMLSNGIIAVGDICNNSVSLFQKARNRIVYHNFVEVSGVNTELINDRFERSLGFFNEFSRIYKESFTSNSLVPHAPYSVADELLNRIIHFPGNRILTIHNQESASEDEWFQSKTGAFTELFKTLNSDTMGFRPSGKSSLQSYLHRFLPGQSVLLVHNLFTSEQDLIYTKNPAVRCTLFWCLCPNANQYISGILPDLDLFIRHGAEIVLGTDSLASNQHLDILSEIKTLLNHFPDIKPEVFLTWATSNGARALGLFDRLGSFEKGKKPGILLISESFDQVQRLL